MSGRRYRRFFRLGLGPQDSPEAQVDEEIETHLSLRTESLIRTGLSPEAARREAMRRFGDFSQARRALRAGARRRATVAGLAERCRSALSDVRLAWRQAARAPVFSLVAVATLGLGIGATTTTFTLVRTVLVAPLPYPDPDRLVRLSSRDSLARVVPVVSSANWIDWRRESPALAVTALHQSRQVGVIDEGRGERVWAALVTGDFFRVLSPTLRLGRPLTSANAEAGAGVAVVSEGFWRRALGGVWPVERPITVEGRATRVVGVFRRADQYPAGADLWLPVQVRPASGGQRNNINWIAIARLSPGVSLPAAETELGAVARGIRERDPAALYSYGVEVAPLKSEIVGDAFSYLALLFGAVGLVLLVACANLATGHLARALARRRELAVRAALGAGRGRLLRQQLVEHGLLGAIGGGLGLLLAWTGLRLIVRGAGAALPRVAEVRLDGTVVGFAVLATLGAGFLAGLGPALRGAGVAPIATLGRGRGDATGGRRMAGAGLIALEVAVALVLLTGAGLLIRSLRQLLARDLGFDPAVVTVSASLTGERYAREGTARIEYWERLRAALAGLPGARAAGVANWVPLSFAGKSFVEVEGGSAPGGMGYRVVSEDYFQTLGVPLRAGRVFQPSDATGGERVALVNARAAADAWPGESPVGRRLRATSFEAGREGAPAPWLTVIGVVGDLRQWGPLVEPEAELYVLLRQVPQHTVAMTAVVKPVGNPAALMTRVRAAAQAIDPTIAVEVSTLEATLAQQLATRRLLTALLTGFGGFALFLTAIGLYGTLAYALSRRTRELALRSALGAKRLDLMRLALASGLAPVAIGALAGVAAALALTRTMRSELVDVSPLDPWSMGAAVAVVGVVAALATLIPAYRATRVDPMERLREDG